MKNLLPFQVKLNTVSESMISLGDFLKTSYNEKKEWLAESIAFLKDFTQMEEEFRQELTKKNEFVICLGGEMVSESEVLSRPMEENY
jgi:shikimate kinase